METLVWVLQTIPGEAYLILGFCLVVTIIRKIKGE